MNLNNIIVVLELKGFYDIEYQGKVDSGELFEAELDCPYQILVYEKQNGFVDIHTRPYDEEQWIVEFKNLKLK